MINKKLKLASVRKAAFERSISLGLVFSLAVLCLINGPQVRAQSQAANSASPTFEVASIKPSADLTATITSGKMPHIGMRIDDSQVDIGSFTLAQLISTAYKVKPFQVSGPEWIKTTRFDILAKLPDGATKEQVPDMLRALLEDRFKLEIHRDTKDEPIYALIVGKNGPKLTPSPPDVPDTLDPNRLPEKGETVMDTGRGQMRIKTTGAGEGATTEISGGPTGRMKMSMANGMMHLETSKTTMLLFAEQLTPFLDRPVVDKTDLKGNFVVAMDLSMEDLMAVSRNAGFGVRIQAAGGQGPADSGAAPSAPEPSGHSIFASVEKLGLKLDKQKAPFEFIVVDHMEKIPTEN